MNKPVTLSLAQYFHCHSMAHICSHITAVWGRQQSSASSIQSSRVCGKQGGKQQSSLILGLALAESYLPNRHNH